ncbi:putative Uncharacterized protein C9orf78 [Hypsibius exemplaris]|uniref:Telomere length and silencing protein 1 n=1 Tax=Hypsibius exemplaris TaxID=2072580 RepID=A0A1W0WMB5_HYPEX|nr:putative Uncharacterized protein C9orf78 [Hypsibius exemplaris]
MSGNSDSQPDSVHEKPSGFKKRGAAARIRKRVHSGNSDGSDEDVLEAANVVAETLELQKLRKRPHGVSIEDLAASRGEVKDHKPDADLSSLQTGGMMSARTARAMAALPSLESGGQHIDVGTEFSAETQRRDEDYDMMKFIEEEVAKRKITGVAREEHVPVLSRPIVRPEDALLVVAENFKRDTGKKSEEMLSHQMLSGIPEIDLGIEAKIKNIEATEEAKRRLMQKFRDSSPDTRLPVKSSKETAMDYVQHSRYNLESYKSQTEAVPDLQPSNAAGGAAGKSGSAGKADSGKPSDDAIFERYRSNFKDKVEKDKKKRRDK